MAFINHILVPTDFSKYADAALEFAMKMAGDTGATLHLLNVDDDPVLNSPTTSEEFRSKIEDRLATMLASLLDDDQRHKFHAEYAILRGDASLQIVEYAQKHDMDLIVMGTKGRSAIADILLGSVATKVLRHSHCPVVSVHIDNKAM